MHDSELVVENRFRGIDTLGTRVKDVGLRIMILNQIRSYLVDQDLVKVDTSSTMLTKLGMPEKIMYGLQSSR